MPKETECPSGYLFDKTNIAPTAFKCIVTSTCTANTVSGVCTSTCSDFGAYYNLVDTSSKTAPFDC